MSMYIYINEKRIDLKVSMWLVDEDRYTDMANQRPKSIIWKSASLIYLAHVNYQRKQKAEPVITAEEIEEWIEDQTSTAAGVKRFVDLNNELTAEIRMITDAVAETSTEEEKKIIVGEIPERLRSVS